MVDSARSTILANPSIAVVKVGTNVLADGEGKLDQGRIRALAEQIGRVRTLGWQVVLVSSGAIGAGVGKLQLKKRPTDLPHLQACAAVGQSALMQLYLEAFAVHGILPAQILLTASDFDHRVRYLNVRHTIHTLFEYSCIPIINENDTVSVAEIKFGDNDQLAAMVANLLQAKLLVLLTNVDGLYTADPRSDPSARLVLTVPSIDSSITGLAGATRSDLGTGGMKSKLKAARIATAAGCSVIMANGSSDGVLDTLFAGREVGTLFQACGEHLPAWKRWLGFTAQPNQQPGPSGFPEIQMLNGKIPAALGLPNPALEGIRAGNPPNRGGDAFQREWLDACKGKSNNVTHGTSSKTHCDFDYSGTMMEQMLLGLVAHRVGKKLTYDPVAGRVTNVPEANDYLKRTYRPNWTLNG